MKLLRRRESRPEPQGLPVAVGSRATWWAQATPGTTYVRCLVPSSALPGDVRALEPTSLVMDADGEAIIVGQNTPVAIWQFPGNATRAIIMAEMQTQGYKVLIEVDDNYLKPPPVKTGWSLSIDRSETDNHSFQAHRKIVKWCDGIIASTETLAERYRDHVGHSVPVYVCENSIRLVDWPKWPDRPEGPVRVGYAGSDSHVFDLAFVDDALDWAYRDGAQLFKMGAASKPWRWEHMQVPWANNTGDYRRILTGAFDIGLCPLKRGEWADCKSDLKVLEYLAAGILPIVQGDTPVYAEWTSMLPHASTPKQWKKVVREIVALDEVERTKIFNDAYSYMLEYKTIERTIYQWEEAVE